MTVRKLFALDGLGGGSQVLQQYKEALGSQALPALQVILQFLEQHAHKPGDAERLVGTVVKALGAVDSGQQWEPLARQIVAGSAAAVEELSKRLLPDVVGIDTALRADAVWVATLFHNGREFQGQGEAEVASALDALTNCLSAQLAGPSENLP